VMRAFYAGRCADQDFLAPQPLHPHGRRAA